MSGFRYYREDNFPPIVKNLMIINALVFLAQISFDPMYALTARIALWPVDSPFFQPYQIVTHMFSHGSWGHILFNMFALWLFGKTLESRWGPKRFLFCYLASGIGAAALHLAVEHYMGGVAPAVGASGAIMGIIISFAYLFPNTQLYVPLMLLTPIPIKAKWAAIIYVATDLFSGIARASGDNVAHFAHLGGALTGFILVLIWNKTDRRNFY